MIIYYVANDHNVAVFELEVERETKQLYYLNRDYKKLLFGYGWFSYSQLNKVELVYFNREDAIVKAKELIKDKIAYLQTQIEKWESYL